MKRMKNQIPIITETDTVKKPEIQIRGNRSKYPKRQKFNVCPHFVAGLSLRSDEPKLVKKRQRLLDGTEDSILSLYAKGMSVKDIQHHLDDLYGYELSTKTISNITEKILEKAIE